MLFAAYALEKSSALYTAMLKAQTAPSKTRAKKVPESVRHSADAPLS